MVVQVPLLREHKDGVALLAETFLQRHAAANHLEPQHLTSHALRCLEQHDWPGNVRELFHVIERGVALSTRAWTDAADLGLDSASPSFSSRLVPQTLWLTRSHPAETLLNLDDLTRHVVTVALA
jgi:DNA-binding NtrC family response regulator